VLPPTPLADFLPADLGSRRASKDDAKGGTSLPLAARFAPMEAWHPREGQYRTLLEVKNDGFAMKNFAARRMERLDQYYETKKEYHRMVDLVACGVLRRKKQDYGTLSVTSTRKG